MKRNIYLMYIIALLQGMIFYGPVATLYRQVHGVSIFQITLIESISLILCILLELPWGIVADKIGYRKTLVFCCWIYLISKIVFWLADGFIWFLAERIMLSFVIDGFSGVDTSILYLSDRENKFNSWISGRKGIKAGIFLWDRHLYFKPAFLSAGNETNGGIAFCTVPASGQDCREDS